MKTPKFILTLATVFTVGMLAGSCCGCKTSTQSVVSLVDATPTTTTTQTIPDSGARPADASAQSDSSTRETGGQ